MRNGLRDVHHRGEGAETDREVCLCVCLPIVSRVTPVALQRAVTSVLFSFLRFISGLRTHVRCSSREVLPQLWPGPIDAVLGV